MEKDFLIRRAGPRWHAEATSKRGQALAWQHPRFTEGAATLDKSETLAFHAELLRAGLRATTPDGLPAPPFSLLVQRVTLALLMAILPIAACSAVLGS